MKMLLTVLIVYVAFALFAWLASDRMIFQPPSSSYRAGQLPILMVPTDGGAIATLVLPNPRAALTVLYAHGNAEDLGQIVPFLEELRRTGFAVIAFDYRGYGMSTGRHRPEARRATWRPCIGTPSRRCTFRRRGSCSTAGPLGADQRRISRRAFRLAGSCWRARS